MRAGSSRLAAALALTCVLGCKDDTPAFVLSITGGLEPAPLAAPSIRRVELRVRSLAGEETAVASIAVGAGGLDLPDAAKVGQGSLVVAGLTAEGALGAYGRTVPIDRTALETGRLPVLVQAPASAARVLKLPRAPTAPRCGLIGVRFLVLGDPSSTALQVVDLLTLTAADEANALPFAPETLATAGGFVLAISAKGEVALVDLEQGTTTTPSPPTGMSFADVVGGRVVRGEDGAAWLVGATRPTGATDVVLRLGPDGTLAGRRLGVARTSAAATFIEGRGLLVAYGVPTGPVELLSTTATTAATLPFPASEGSGGLLAAWGSGRALRLDPDGHLTVLDLACASSCTAQAMAGELGKGGARDEAIAVEGGGVLSVRANGTTLIDDKGKLDLGAGAPGSCAVQLPTGAVALGLDADPILRAVLGRRGS